MHIPETGGPENEAVSATLKRLGETMAGDRISLGALISALDDRGGAFLALVLTIPNVIPAPPLPLFSTAFAVPLVLIAAQQAFGRTVPWVPRVLARCSVRRSTFQKATAASAPTLERIERWLSPRPSWLTGPGGTRLLAAAIVVLAIVMALPIPLGSLPPSLAILVIALGQLQRDRLACLAGLVMGLGSCIWSALLVIFGTAMVGAIRHYFGS